MPLLRKFDQCRLVRWCLGAALVLAMLPGFAYARHPDLDLDAQSDGDIDELLQAELDDDDLIACGIGDPDAPMSKQQMFNVIICALGDRGDDDDEDDLDFDDLQDEMNEAGTTVEDVVWQALDRADEIAMGPSSTAAGLLGAAHPGEPPSLRAVRPDAVLYAIRDGRINPGRAAVVPIKGGLIRGIRSR
jgi:hypothetical protein